MNYYRICDILIMCIVMEGGFNYGRFDECCLLYM